VKKKLDKFKFTLWEVVHLLCCTEWTDRL